MKRKKTPFSHTRYRDFACITYVEPADFQHVLRACKHFVYIYHNEDNNAHHYHVLLRMLNGHTVTAVKSMFSAFSNQNTLVEYMSHPYECFRYLTHSDNPEKWQYSISDIVSDSLFYWQSLMDEDDTTQQNARIIQLLDDILNQTSYRKMVERYGRDYVINFDKYVSMALNIKNSEKKSDELLDLTQETML